MNDNLTTLLSNMDSIHDDSIKLLDYCHDMFLPTEKDRQRAIIDVKQKAAMIRVILDQVERDAVKSIEEFVI